MTKNIECKLILILPLKVHVCVGDYQSIRCVSEGKRNEHNGITPVLVLK